MNHAKQTFDAMSIDERQNLVNMNFWLDPERQRRKGEHLLGPDYESLQRHGVIRLGERTSALGKAVVITNLGRVVLHYIAIGKISDHDVLKRTLRGA